MKGYTDQEWARAVSWDWLEPDHPVPLDTAMNIRRHGTDCTVRSITAVREFYFNLPHRFSDRETSHP